MLTKVFDISDNSIDQEDPEEITQEVPEEVTQEDPEEFTQEDPEEISQEDPEEVTQEDPEEFTQEDLEEELTQEVPEDSSDVYYYYQISENSVSSNCVTFDQLAFFDTTIIFLLACVLGALVFNAFMKKL